MGLRRAGLVDSLGALLDGTASVNLETESAESSQLMHPKNADASPFIGYASFIFLRSTSFKPSAPRLVRCFTIMAAPFSLLARKETSYSFLSFSFIQA